MDKYVIISADGDIYGTFDSMAAAQLWAEAMVGIGDQRYQIKVVYKAFPV